MQKRLNKKKPSKKLQTKIPIFVRLYDILFFNGIDIRNKNLIFRKEQLKKFYSEYSLVKNFDMSEIIKFSNFIDLQSIYNNLYNSKFIEGLMIKSKSSLYVAGRKQNLWLKMEKVS